MPLPDDSKKTVRRLRVLYAAGPGDVLGTYKHWRAGREDPQELAKTYSSQFFSVCRELDAQALVIATHPRRQSMCDGRFEIRHRPVPLSRCGGVLYHLGQLWHGLRLLAAALRFKADVAIVSDYSHWFILSAFPLLGIEVVASLHCVMWSQHRPVPRTQRMLNRLNRGLFRRRCLGSMVVSHNIGAQIAGLAGRDHRPIIEFSPTYCPEMFQDVAAPPPGPFRVLYVGRVEAEKGAFDILEIARRFAAEGHEDIHFDVCGDGSSLVELRQEVEAAGLGKRVRCHGHCRRRRMRKMFERAHVVIVPTRTDFVEGFNKVVAEAVLFDRPVITSSVCASLDYFEQAVIEVPPDDVKAYGDAILALHSDPAYYQRARSACQQQKCGRLLNDAASFAAALRRVLGQFPQAQPCAVRRNLEVA